GGAQRRFHEYTGLPERLVEDTRSVTAVEGTKATLSFRLNKPVKEARLVPSDAKPQAVEPVALSVDASDPSLYTVAFDLKDSRRFRLQLLDERGRHNKQPAPELALNV